MAGKLINLYNLFGYFSPSPKNRTEKEVNNGDKGLGASALDSMSWYHDNTKSSGDYKQHMTELNEMSRFEFIQPIIDLYAEEATQPDVEKNKTIWYECNDSEIEKDLNNMLEQINVEDSIYSIAFDIAAFGNSTRRILRNDTHGITMLPSVPPVKLERIWEPTTKRLIGFRWDGQEPANDDSKASVGNETIFAPWEFMHFRRIGRNTDSEYGEALVEHLFPLYRKLRMGLDQMLIYRLHTMPNRFVVYVDTGTQPVSEAMETVNMFKNHFRQSLSASKDSFEARYNPAALDSMLFFPLPKDSTTKIDTMRGDTDVPDVPDLKLLFNMLFGAARVPKAYLGFEEDEGGLSNSSLVTKDMRFARMIRVLRRPIVFGFHRLAQLHLAFKGLDATKHNIKVHMSKICAIEEEVKASMMEKQANMAGTIIDLCQKLAIPNKDIVELVFREILHLPSNFVNVAKLAMSVQQAVGQPGQDMAGGMGGGMPGGLGNDLGLTDPSMMPGGMGADGAVGPGVTPEPGAPLPPGEQTLQPGPANQLASTGITSANLAEAMRLFEVGLKKTLVESADANLTESFKAAAWELRSTLNDYYKVRSTQKVSLVESYAAPRANTLEPSYSKDAIVESAKVAQAASKHPQVQLAQKARQVQR